MGRENHNRLLLLIPSLSLKYIFRSSVFPQTNTNMNFIEPGLKFIKMGRLGPHIMYNSKTEWGGIKHRRGFDMSVVH
jgi:hypothetical protein